MKTLCALGETLLLHCFLMSSDLESGKTHNFDIIDEGLLLTILKIDDNTVSTI